MISGGQDTKSELLHRNNVTDYYAEYRFRNDSLYLFGFGFRGAKYAQQQEWEKKNGLDQFGR